MEQKPVGIDNLGRKEFLSWAEFRNVFDRWCKKNKYLFKIKCYKILSRTDSTSSENMKAIKYSFIQLVCKYSVVNQHSLRSSSGELPTPCQASIIVQAGPQHDRLIVTHSELDHNHTIAVEEFESLFPRFMLKAKPFQFLEMTNNISKQFLRLNDLNELVYQSCDEETSLKDLLDELNLIFCKDPKVKIKLLFHPDIAEVEGIYLMTSAMNNLLQRFPSVLYIDQTMSINDDFYLYTAICEDANQIGRTCGYFITLKKSETPVRFMVVSIMQSIPEFVKYLIKTVVLHAGLDEIDLVETLLPSATVLMSHGHALKVLQSRIKEEKRSVQVEMKKIICNLVYSSTDEKYKRNLRLLKATASSSFLDYFLNDWHLHKESWVSGLGQLDPRIRFDYHIKKHVQSLESICPTPSLTSSINSLLNLQSFKVLTSTLDENMTTDFYNKLCHPDFLKLIQEEFSFAIKGFYSISETAEGFLVNDRACDFIVNRHQFQCSCFVFESSKLPCRHIFAARLWNGETVLEKILIQKMKAN
ncbi:uncharacterized protein ZSWIM9 [Xenopus laevis]|uniref:Uncharacterized protein ZSWIM9 n=1 Tax=Xenopus laevis TaxID=8355 RepID=A0A8J0TD26_XENLA|nr:uncharacterized protein ZSWIM9 [Xenopus laevis]